MTIDRIDNSQRTAAKVAGWSGLLTFAIVVFGNYVLLNPLVVSGNAAATAQNIVAHQTQLRITVVCFLTYTLGVVVLLTALYVIFKPINPGLALAGALFRFVFALLWLLAPLNLLGALRLLSNANCAWLWLKSNYIPQGLAIFGVISSVWCVLCAFVFLIFPNFNKIVNDYVFDTPMAIFELVVSLWLLVKGLQPSRIATAHHRPERALH